MPPARRVVLAPPAPWDEARLLAEARFFKASKGALRPGDAIGDLVVLSVEPAPPAPVSGETEVEIVPQPRATTAPRVELAILVDVSASMAEPWSADHTRLSAARAALTAFLQAPGASVADITVYEFANAPRAIAGPGRDLKLLDAPVPRGRAATGAALNAALADLAGRAPTNCQAILLLSDGVGEPAEVEAATRRAARLRVPVHSLVFAPELDPLFGDLARATGGTAQRAMLPLTIEFEHQPGGSPP